VCALKERREWFINFVADVYMSLGSDSGLKLTAQNPESQMPHRCAPKPTQELGVLFLSRVESGPSVPERSRLRIHLCNVLVIFLFTHKHLKLSHGPCGLRTAPAQVLVDLGKA